MSLLLYAPFRLLSILVPANYAQQQLHREILDLKSRLKESVPGSNSRAEAAERSLFEVRRSLVSSLTAVETYHLLMCRIRTIAPTSASSLMGEDIRSAYTPLVRHKHIYSPLMLQIHEDLLQLGKEGGLEAANRLHKEVSSYLQQFSEAKGWEIMVHLYVDVEGLLARCVSNDIPLSESCVKGFMLGFAHAQPLFTIMDVGRGQDRSLSKVEGMCDFQQTILFDKKYLSKAAMFHLFANNAQCKHLIFGCCHDAAYVPTLEKYTCNPIMASSITLLKSYEVLTFFQGLPFEFVEFPTVFRSTPYKATDRLAEGIDDVQDLQQQIDFNRIPQQTEQHNAKKEAGVNEAIAKWQATAGTSWPVLAPARPPAKASSDWTNEKKVLLNINDERVDQELGEIDHETSESMLDRIEERRFCLFYHLQDSCVTHLAGKPCNYRHEPRLNEQELRFLKRESQRRPCSFGSRCRRPDCIYGHVCPHQPGCERGPTCALYKFHEIDKTAVKVWSSEKRLSPRKKVWRT